jgi:NAD(P)-dependent dehydrogenase (short-subunit alcohol dehydrogenase family)
MGIRLDEDVVLITGGTRGVGRGIAGRFAAAGARIAVCARRPPDEELPEGWVFVAADLRDAEAAAGAVDAVVERFGRIDCVVNNAGGSPPAETATASARFSERIVALNLLAPLHVAQRANHHMQAGDGGTIVNITSVVALRPAPGAAAYGAAKAGLVNLTATLGQEWAPKVRVNAVCCGMIRTEQSALFYGDDEGIARVGATVPLGRLATPDEIGDVAVWLASDQSSYVTGSNVVVHGGGDKPPFIDAAGP